jgi:uncharacterized protein (TIGR03118 family)
MVRANWRTALPHERSVTLHRIHLSRPAALAVAAAAALVVVAPAAAYAGSGAPPVVRPVPLPGHDLALKQVNLASDVAGLARRTDPDLKNPWGSALTATSPLWVANQATDSSTLYSLAPGSSIVSKSAAVRVTLSGSAAGPSGVVANPGTGFVLSNAAASAPAAFIFATLDGHIEAWSPKVDPLIGGTEDKATVPGAAYTGLAIAGAGCSERLFAADFAKGTVDVFNSSFRQVKLARWQFTDPRLPRGYVPFNAQALDGRIFVTYDKPDPVDHDEGVGAGIGVVDEFTTSGRLVARVATGGALNAPWGLAIAPRSWGHVAGSLLVGNFGDGRINIFAREGRGFADHATGHIVDTATGKPFAEPGLWSLTPGTTTTGGTNSLWFAAGINDEKDGLLGVLRP